MPPNSWQDLANLGWTEGVSGKTGRKVYHRPNGRLVSQRRNLTSEERDVIGDILFPPRGRASVTAQAPAHTADPPAEGVDHDRYENTILTHHPPKQGIGVCKRSI